MNIEIDFVGKKYLLSHKDHIWSKDSSESKIQATRIYLKVAPLQKK